MGKSGHNPQSMTQWKKEGEGREVMSPTSFDYPGRKNAESSRGDLLSRNYMGDSPKMKKNMRRRFVFTPAVARYSPALVAPPGLDFRCDSFGGKYFCASPSSCHRGGSVSAVVGVGDNQEDLASRIEEAFTHRSRDDLGNGMGLQKVQQQKQRLVVEEMRNNVRFLFLMLSENIKNRQSMRDDTCNNVLQERKTREVQIKHVGSTDKHIIREYEWSLKSLHHPSGAEGGRRKDIKKMDDTNIGPLKMTTCMIPNVSAQQIVDGWLNWDTRKRWDKSLNDGIVVESLMGGDLDDIMTTINNSEGVTSAEDMVDDTFKQEPIGENCPNGCMTFDRKTNSSYSQGEGILITPSVETSEYSLSSSLSNSAYGVNDNGVDDKDAREIHALLDGQETADVNDDDILSNRHRQKKAQYYEEWGVYLPTNRPLHLPIANLQDRTRAVQHLTELMFRNSDDFTECMNCSSPFRTGNYYEDKRKTSPKTTVEPTRTFLNRTVCPCCGLVLCIVCVSNQVWEVHQCQIVMVCEHCYRSSSRIRHPDIAVGSISSNQMSGCGDANNGTQSDFGEEKGDDESQDENVFDHYDHGWDVSLHGCPPNLRIANIYDRSVEVEHLTSLMLRKESDITHCMVCDSPFSEGSGDDLGGCFYQVRYGQSTPLPNICTCCGSVLCQACCSQRVWEVNLREVISVCSHCYEHSSRIRLPVSIKPLPDSTNGEKNHAASKHCGLFKGILSGPDTQNNINKNSGKSFLPVDTLLLDPGVPHTTPGLSSDHEVHGILGGVRRDLEMEERTMCAGQPRILYRTVKSNSMLPFPRETCVLQDSFTDKDGTTFLYELSVFHEDVVGSRCHNLLEVIILALVLSPAGENDRSVLTVISQENPEYGFDASGLIKNILGEGLALPKDTRTDPDVTMKDFCLLSVLGRGGFGKVVQVKHKSSGKVYAMKILKKGNMTSQQIERVHTERFVLEKGHHHPFLVSLFFAFQSKYKLYMVMDFVQGGDFFTLLNKHGRMKEDWARFYICEVVSALQYIHNLHIIYRDLKPENVLLCRDGHIKLVDFGLSRKFSTETSFLSFSFCGTEQYMAPEMLLRRGHNESVDFWCLGLLLHEMLTGRHPFLGLTHHETLSNILSKNPQIDQKLSRNARALLAGLLTKDWRGRIGTSSLGARNLHIHPFFDGISWNEVQLKRLCPPCLPKVNGPADVSNFDSIYRKEKAMDSLTSVEKGHQKRSVLTRFFLATNSSGEGNGMRGGSRKHNEVDFDTFDDFYYCRADTN